eukprot:SAG11_NODE_6547_length_1290_cov_3.626364_2_plen_70_part_00
MTKLVFAGALLSGTQGYGVRSREIAPLPEVIAGVAAGAGHLELVVLLDVRVQWLTCIVLTSFCKIKFVD